MEWEVVIGLEIHAQLNTNTKIFSGASTAFGSEPNTQADLVSLGMPGVLPVFNEQALYKAVQFGVAVGAKIGKRSAFDRKNYFYPDSPKAYQITQMDHPIVCEGELEITLDDGRTKVIGITRAHLEEDAGKSVHDGFDGCSGIDLNRCGTPLIEIVSEPDMRSAKEAVAYVKKIHSIVTAIEINDGNLSQGSMRADCNVSVRPKGQEEFGTRTEIKNVNSFKFIEKAINVEIERQINLIEDGGTVVQETRLYDADKNETRSMRSKEVANDYRYFPEPDLLPIVIDDAYIEAVKAALPELPIDRAARFEEQYNLSAYDADILSTNKIIANFFEKVIEQCGESKLASNWIQGDLLAALNKNDLEADQNPVSAENFATLITRLKDGDINAKQGKQVFEALWNQEGDVDAIIDTKGLKQVSDTGAIEALIDEIMEANPNQVEQFRGGKDKLMGFFVGQTMKASKGQFNPAIVNQILKEKLAG